MSDSEIETRLRARLPLKRMAQAYLPLWLMHWLIRHGSKRVQLPDDVLRQSVRADGVSCDWLIPENCLPDRVLLYLHGGGFVYPQTPPHLQMGAYLARESGLRTLMVDYRVAPAHPYPAALEDCVTAYRWLISQGFEAKQIVIAGDSAGGNLTLTTLMRLRDLGLPLPVAGACLSPVANLAHREYTGPAGEDPLLHPKARRFYSRSYVGANDPRDPLISPEFGSWQGLPPLLIHAGDDEVLKADAFKIQQLATAAGVEVTLEIYPRMWHVWQINLPLPQARHSLNAIAQFLSGRLRKETDFSDD